MIWTFESEQTDDLAVRVRRLERGFPTLRGDSQVASSGNYTAVPADLLSSGQLDLSAQGGLVTRGSISPVGFSGKFGFTATTTTITVYWDGTNGSTKFQRLGIDGSVSQVTGSSMTVSGLTINTAYGFLPFYSAYNFCGIGFVKGDSGTPTFAFTAAAQTSLATQQQNLVGREPMNNGFVTYSTTPAGSSSGSGGGGSACVMLGTHIETLGDLPSTESHFPQNDWYRIKAKECPRTLYCTPDHPLFHAVKGKMQAQDFEVGDLIITDCGEFPLEVCEPHTRVCTKIKVEMAMGHLFWANGYLSHNAKIVQP